MMDPTMRVMALIEALQFGPGRDQDMIVKAVNPATFTPEMRALGLEIADRMDAQRATYGALLRAATRVAPDYTQAEIDAEFAVNDPSRRIPDAMFDGAVSHTCICSFAEPVSCSCNF